MEFKKIVLHYIFLMYQNKFIDTISMKWYLKSKDSKILFLTNLKESLILREWLGSNIKINLKQVKRCKNLKLSR